MDNEIQLIEDDYGLTVIGDPTDIEQFLSSQGLESIPINITAQKTLNVAGAAIQAGSEAMQQSGRWVKLTEESARKIKQFGLIKNNSTGYLTGVIGKGGRGGIKGNVQFVKGPSTLNPMMLAGVGTIMTQIAMQQMMDQITDYLETINEKVDDILRAQKDAEISKMIGAGIVIGDALIERDHIGKVSEITWSEIQATKQTLASAQAYALRQLDAFADKLERTSDVGKLANTMKRGLTDIPEWLAVMAKCLQLQDGYSVLKLDHVQGSTPDELNQYRATELASRHRRLELVSRTTDKLAERISKASQNANKQVLLHPIDSPAVIDNGNLLSTKISDFSRTVGVASTEQSIKAKEWLDAAAETRDWVIAKGAEGANAIANSTVHGAIAARDATGKMLGDAGKAIGGFVNGIFKK